MLNFVEFYIFLMLIPIWAYFRGKNMSDYKDFKHPKIPRKISWLFFVRYNRGRIPLNVAITQICSLLYIFSSFLILVYYIITKNYMISIFCLSCCFCLYLFVSVIDALYAAICDFTLRKK